MEPAVQRHRFTVEETVTVCTEPATDGYSAERTLRHGREVVCTSVAGLRLRIDRIFEGLSQGHGD